MVKLAGDPPDEVLELVERRRRPGALVMEISTVNDPRWSNVFDLRKRNVVLQCPGSPPYDWAADPDFAHPQS